MSGELNILRQVKERLNAVGRGFCLAKWLQVTLHLHNGHTHSCHHPRTHKIPLEELDEDPSALHLTKYKLKQQEDMLNDIRPPECQYCWNIEDLPGNHMSDRYLKSASPEIAGEKMIDEIVEKARQGQKINPTYIEVSFSNVCNFKCSYCSPIVSSSWVSEIKNHGPYKLPGHNFNDTDYLKQSGQMPLHHDEYNPYVEAFWKWWPDFIDNIRVLRVTGGEPLLDKNTFTLLDKLKDKKRPNLSLGINTNCGIPDKIIDKFIPEIQYLVNNGYVGSTKIYTSVDAHGAQAEYGRNGLCYDKWLSNVDRLLTELPGTKVTIMCTANIFSITSFEKLLKDVYELKIKHYNDKRKVPISIDISTLRWPAHQNVSILTPEYSNYLNKSLEYMKERKEGANGNNHYKGFFEYEIIKLERLVEAMQQDPNASENINVNQARAGFYAFVTEHDRRRKTNFLETFPELEQFYETCKAEYEKIIPTKNIS